MKDNNNESQGQGPMDNNHNKRYTARINDQDYEFEKPDPTGREMLEKVGLSPEDYFLVFPIEGQPAQVVELDEPFDLSAPGTERFILTSKSSHFAIRIDETNYNVVGPFIIGRQLLALAGKDPETHMISLSLPNQDDPFIDPDERVDLSAPGREQFYIEVKKPLSIVIDEVVYHPGQKEMTGEGVRQLPSPPIAASRDLWLDVPGKDDRKIDLAEVVRLKDGMVFYTAPSTINPGKEGALG